LLRDLKETSEIIKMDENITENEATLDSLLSEDMNIVKIVDEDGKEEYEKTIFQNGLMVLVRKLSISL
jgi:hypothetical protein